MEAEGKELVKSASGTGVDPLSIDDNAHLKMVPLRIVPTIPRNHPKPITTIYLPRITHRHPLYNQQKHARIHNKLGPQPALPAQAGHVAVKFKFEVNVGGEV
jgi:hypothetical protein